MNGPYAAGVQPAGEEIAAAQDELTPVSALNLLAASLPFLADRQDLSMLDQALLLPRAAARKALDRN